MTYHPVTKQITDLLTEHGVWFETFEHEPVRTSKQAAEVRDGYELNQGAKSLIVRVKLRGGGKKYAMLVFPADQRFQTSKVKKLFNSKDVRFATEEEVGELTGGVLPGGVPPFGLLFNLEVIADKTLMENEKIIFNAGDRSFSVAMHSTDYKNIVQPRIEAIV